MSGASLVDLFREEARAQAHILSDGLLALERAPTDPVTLEACMRAAHSLKGAARIVGVPVGVSLAHVMEDCFVGAQQGRVNVDAAMIDVLLAGVDLIVRIGQTSGDETVPQADVDRFVDELNARMSGDAGEVSARPPASDDFFDLSKELTLAAPLPEEPPLAAGPKADFEPARPLPVWSPAEQRESTRMLRVRTDTLDRLLSHSGESLVESRWLKPFAQSMLRVKRIQRDASRALDFLHESLTESSRTSVASRVTSSVTSSVTSTAALDVRTLATLDEIRRLNAEAQRQLGERLAELENYDRRTTHLSQQLYDEALECRMRPFVDATGGFARMVRDVARSLDKQVRLAIAGVATEVDRDILDMLEAPLGHLLRNAVDHGIEPPSLRRALGKPPEGTITLDARHSAGSLFISVSDDGGGVDLPALRRAIVRKRLSNESTVARLSEPELLEFLFLPGFSMRDTVTDVSGRGVGLDAVHDVVRQVRGSLRVTQEELVGTRFVMQLPLTLSVIRSLIVEVDSEPYGLPLAHVVRTLVLPRASIDLLEGHQHFEFEGRRLGIVTAHQILRSGTFSTVSDTLNVVVIGQGAASYGVVVDRFLGERMLVVQPLDKRLGKVPSIAAGALMENGDPLLIADIDDWLRAVEKLVVDGELGRISQGTGQDAARVVAAPKKRVLVVDDSLTVRELERKLLASRGYDVTIAVDGMDGWNAVRGDRFDLVITDIDMPRLDGIELVALIRRDPHLRDTPVMIVSYKDRAEDRQRGLDAGADYYLAKGSFHDQTLLDAVRDLIGEAQP
jgi:two-component system sensor histidine kinase and response regulator WspE